MTKIPKKYPRIQPKFIKDSKWGKILKADKTLEKAEKLVAKKKK